MSRLIRLVLFALLAFAGPARADDEPLRIHLISGSTEYRSEASLVRFRQILEERFQQVIVTASWGQDAGNNLPNVAALAEADLVIIFTRRMVLPEDQLRYLQEHFRADRPAIGIRTSSHAFQGYLAMDAEIFGGNYSGHGDDESAEVSLVMGATDHPILDGIRPWTRPDKIYRNPGLGSATEPLLYARGQASGIHEPVAWTNRYGTAGRAFYTSMGLPHDFENEQFLRMLFQAIEWTSARPLNRVGAP